MARFVGQGQPATGVSLPLDDYLDLIGALRALGGFSGEIPGDGFVYQGVMVSLQQPEQAE